MNFIFYILKNKAQFDHCLIIPLYFSLPLLLVVSKISPIHGVHQVVWWHPLLFPSQTLRRYGVDYLGLREGAHQPLILVVGWWDPSTVTVKVRLLRSRFWADTGWGWQLVVSDTDGKLGGVTVSTHCRGKEGIQLDKAADTGCASCL